MVYSQQLAGRVRDLLGHRPGICEKKMFGGLAFFRRGNLVVGVSQDALIIRVGPEEIQQALARPHVSSFAPTGRPMNGWGMVSAAGLEHDQAVADWVKLCLEFVQTLPPK